MHRPPAVSYSVVRSRWHACMLGTVWGLGAILVQLASWGYRYTPAAVVAMACVCLTTGLSALWAWRGAPQGMLRWDGDLWYWSGFAGVPVGRVTTHFDFQTVLLVSVHCKAHARAWLWLDHRVVSRANWLALRRALVASRRPPRADQAAPPHEQLL